MKAPPPAARGNGLRPLAPLAPSASVAPRAADDKGTEFRALAGEARPAPHFRDRLKGKFTCVGLALAGVFALVLVALLISAASFAPGGAGAGACDEGALGALVDSAPHPAWLPISTTKACEANSDGITRKKGAAGYTLQKCLITCRKTAGCKAVDFYSGTAWCNFYDKACSTPQTVRDGSQSFKLKESSGPVSACEATAGDDSAKFECCPVTAIHAVVKQRMPACELTWAKSTEHRHYPAYCKCSPHDPICQPSTALAVSSDPVRLVGFTSLVAAAVVVAAVAALRRRKGLEEPFLAEDA